MGNPPRTRTAHLWGRLFSPVNRAGIDYLSSRHLGALIESSDPLAADGGLGARGGFLFPARAVAQFIRLTPSTPRAPP